MDLDFVRDLDRTDAHFVSWMPANSRV